MSGLELDLGQTSRLEIRLNDRVIKIVEFQPQNMSVPDAVRIAAVAIEANELEDENAWKGKREVVRLPVNRRP